VFLNKVAANLGESGSPEILYTLVERIEQMILPRNEWTDRIEKALLAATGKSRDEVKQELTERREERKRSRTQAAAVLASAKQAAEDEGGVVGKLKGLFWKR
jgi:F0F1-type ATP synthase membrane subunit b/b'